MDRLLEVLALLAWTCPWAIGGWLLAFGLFRLGRGESAVIGFSLGLVLQVWMANLASQVVAIPLSFWLASALVLVFGVAANLRPNRRLRLTIRPGQWILLACLTALFTAIGRGLGVFDDYQNLPTVSLMAAGDVPPHFALDPSLRFGYHYLLLLFAAELMRLANMLPWSALDLARGIMLGLPLLVAGLWMRRLTHSNLASVLGCCVLALAGGSRWLLLLLPPALVNQISGEITLIGSAASSAPRFSEAMVSPWRIDGGGPIPFPFAFYSGINQPYIMLYTGIAGSGILIMLLILLTAQRWRHGAASIVTIALLSALAMANEIAFLLLGLGMLLVSLTASVSNRGAADRRRWLLWMGMETAALAIALVQGGMLTEVAASWLRHDAAASSYFDPTPVLVWPPAIVSAHLGSLSVANPLQLIAALLEIGPVVLVTPWLLMWIRRGLQHGRLFEAGVIASSAGALLSAFLAFKGPLFTAGPRLMSGWFFVSALYFIPLLWIWARSRREAARVGVAAAAFLSCMGGLVLFGVQLAAIQRPVYATFISQMDAKIAQEEWNRLEAGELVFDPLIFRAPTVFGRATRSSPTWYTRSQEWEQLRDAADPVELNAAGFGYMYFDGEYWEQLSATQQGRLTGACVRQVLQVDGIRSETDYTKDFRRLLDIRQCK